MLAINEKDSMILSMKIYEKYIYMKYWDNSGFLARIEDKGITVLLEWDAYLALDICETLNESNKFFLYSRNTGKVWLVDSKREVIDELDLRCSNLRHMLVDNKNENILYELYQQNGSCKVYYQPIGEIAGSFRRQPVPPGTQGKRQIWSQKFSNGDHPVPIDSQIKIESI